MKNTILLGIGLSAMFTVSLAQDNIATARHTLDQWVETQQIISKEKSDWKLEKSILQDTEKLLNGELQRLVATMEELDASSTAADEARAALAAEKETLATAAAVVEANIGKLEKQVQAVVKTFPAPLVEKIQPLVRRIPKDPKVTKLTLGERVQNIVGILSQADKFNGTITQTSESREIAGGRVIEVRTIYWGLGGAFYVDAAGEYAGVGYPGTNGWEWPEVAGSGPKIKRLLDVYEGSEAIQFVEVPARIK